jgi:hypothetical protein
VLCVGRREDRARLGTRRQVIKYDETGQKVNKLSGRLLPLAVEMIEAVWSEFRIFASGITARRSL